MSDRDFFYGTFKSEYCKPAASNHKVCVGAWPAYGLTPERICHCECHEGKISLSTQKASAVPEDAEDAPITARAPIAPATPKASVASSDTGSIRVWARSQGMKVGERGRLHPDILAAYAKAHGGQIPVAPAKVAPVVKASGADVSGVDIGECRAWARKQGMTVGDRGRIAIEIKQAFLDSTRS